MVGCCVPTCSNYYLKNRNVSYHRIPANEHIASQWKNNINRKTFPKTIFVCSEHFDPDCFEDYSFKSGLRKLKDGSVPTNFTLTKDRKRRLFTDRDNSNEDKCWVLRSDTSPLPTFVESTALNGLSSTTMDNVDNGFNTSNNNDHLNVRTDKEVNSVTITSDKEFFINVKSNKARIIINFSDNDLSTISNKSSHLIELQNGIINCSVLPSSYQANR